MLCTGFVQSPGPQVRGPRQGQRRPGLNRAEAARDGPPEVLRVCLRPLAFATCTCTWACTNAPSYTHGAASCSQGNAASHDWSASYREVRPARYHLPCVMDHNSLGVCLVRLHGEGVVGVWSWGALVGNRGYVALEVSWTLMWWAMEDRCTPASFPWREEGAGVQR